MIEATCTKLSHVLHTISIPSNAFAVQVTKLPTIFSNNCAKEAPIGVVGWEGEGLFSK